MKRRTIKILLTLSGLVVCQAKGESVAGFVHTAVPSNGMALVSMPFTPFSTGLLGDVLHGQLVGDDNPYFSDSVSLWLNDSQTLTNAWLGAFTDGSELNGHWISGASSADAQLFDLPLSSGDTFFIHNRQSTPAHVFVSGYVPLNASTDVGVFPGLNLLSFAYPSSGFATNVLFGGMQSYVSTWDTATQSYRQTSDGVIALGEGFWAERSATNAILWTQPRPFAGAFNRNGLNPQIARIGLDATAPTPSLSIESTPTQNTHIDVLSLNVGRYGDFSLSDWSHADRIASLGSPSLSWRDTASGLSLTNTHARFYIVGDAAIDSDGDGLSDVLEMHVYGTNPANPDTDGDGVADGLEIARGSNPLLADTPALYSFWDGFETNTVTMGDINGQNGWSTSQVGVGVVQTNDCFEGIASLKVYAGNDDEDISVSRTFTNAPEVVWFDLRQKMLPSREIPAEPTNATFCFIFDRQGCIVVLDGRKPSGSQWVVLPDTQITEEWSWVRVSARLDYGTRTYDMYLNGVIVAEGFGFASDAPSLTSLSIRGSHGFYDNISLNSTRPLSLSSDWDTLPDEWEVEMFGSLIQTDQADPDGDGLDNATEYALGTDPLSNDTDGDGMPDGWEISHDLDPNSAADANADLDDDGLSNLNEYQLGTDPHAYDLDPRVSRFGLRAEFYATDTTLTTVPDMDALLIRDLINAPQINYTSTTIAWKNVAVNLKDNFACRLIGYIQVPANGTYTFHLTSDDGAILRIGRAIVVNDSSSHTLRTRSGTITLDKGTYPISVDYFQKTNNATLILEWEGTIYYAGITTCINGHPVKSEPIPHPFPRVVVPSSAFWHLPYGNEPPCATLATADTLFVKGNTIAMNAEAWDVDSDVAELQFCANGIPLFATNSPSASFVWTNAPAGIYSLTAVAIDDFGAASTSMPVSVTVVQAPNGYETGLDATFYDFNTTLTVFPVLNTTAVVSRIDETINYPDTTSPWPGLPASTADTFASVHSGYLFVPESGIYTLSVFSDDGSLLSIDGMLVLNFDGLHSLSERSVTLPLAQGFHTILLKYFENGGSAGLILKWSRPGIAKQVIPSRNFFCLTGIADTDGDGIPDWWEELYGLDAFSASDSLSDPDSDGLSNFDEFTQGTHPSVLDSDGDGMPDGWEVLFGTKPFLADADSDNDLDELKNIDEYLAGSDPLNVDTDGDGITDGVEFHEMGTSPCEFDDYGEKWSVAFIPASNSVTRVGTWTAMGNELRCETRGYVEFEVDFPEMGVYCLDFTATHEWRNLSCSPIDPLDRSRMLISVDGHYVSTRELVAPCLTFATVSAYTPCLPAGRHVVRLFWNNTHERLKLRLQSLEVFGFNGGDENSNGINDWVELAAGNSNGADILPTTSFVSPVCIEGFARFPWTVSAATSTSTGIAEVVVSQGAGDRWFANVPLSSTNAVPVIINYESGFRQTTNTVSWLPLDLFGTPCTSVVVRVGDSLLFDATPEGETNGFCSIAIAGVTGEVLGAGGLAVHQFDVAGVYSVTASFSDETDTTINSSPLLVRVVGAIFPEEGPACMLGKTRQWSCTGIPLSCPIEAGPQMNFSRMEDGKLSLCAMDSRKPQMLIARTCEGGAVVATAQADVFWAQAAVDGEIWVLAKYEDSQLWQNRLVAMQIPPSVDILLKVYVSGVMFDDMTLERWIVSDDLDDAGEYLFALLRPNSISASACHTVKFYQDGILVGEAHYAGLLLPDELD